MTTANTIACPAATTAAPPATTALPRHDGTFTRQQ
jgi:hypothetical protein